MLASIQDAGRKLSATRQQRAARSIQRASEAYWGSAGSGTPAVRRYGRLPFMAVAFAAGGGRKVLKPELNDVALGPGFGGGGIRFTDHETIGLGQRHKQRTVLKVKRSGNQ